MTLWRRECGALAKSPFEAESRLRASPFQGPPLQSRTSHGHAPSRSHRRGHAHVEPLFQSPSNRSAPKGLWEEPTPGRPLFPKPWAAYLMSWPLGSGLDRSGDGGRMRAREHGHARCGPSQRRLRRTSPVRSRLSISIGLFAAARILYAKMSSRQPAAILLRINRNQPPRRNHTSWGRDPGRACAHTPSIEPCPSFPGNQECPH